MEVTIIDFPETRVAALELVGPPSVQHDTARRFIAWRIANGLSPQRHRTYGIHYTDPRVTPAHEDRMDICVSVENSIAPNDCGIVNKVIPGGRCAVARHVGSRDRVIAAEYLCDVWLPASGERLRDFPIYFHYVNIGPAVKDAEMITDVYLPLR
jgi:AraC family transcriptional regulator